MHCLLRYPRRGVREMVTLYRIPSEVYFLVLRRVDTILNSLLGYCAVYQDHFKTGLHFSPLPLLIKILTLE